MTWKIDTNKFYIISTALSSFRLVPLFQFVSFFAFKFIFFVFVAIAFALSLFLIFRIIIMDNNSKIFNRFLSFTCLIMEPLTIFFYIPMTELFLIPLRCDDNNNKLFTKNDAFQCWKGIHLLYETLGVLGAVSLFINLVFMNLFCFYPFQIKSSTIKLNAFFDISLLIVINI